MKKDFAKILEKQAQDLIETSVKDNWGRGYYAPCTVCGEMFPIAELETVLVGDNDHSEAEYVCYHCYNNPDKYVDERGEALDEITKENCKGYGIK